MPWARRCCAHWAMACMAKRRARVKEELLPARLENEILMQQGYCGLARHLREKHLL